MSEAADPVTIEPATPGDLPAVEALLAAEGLPLDGVPAAFAIGVVARHRGRLEGAAAIEAYGPDGLLRSVVTAPVARGRGVGRGLVGAAEALAAGIGVRDLYLLTETAEGWFARLGYERVDRTAAPPAIAGSREFAVVCATTGVLMRRRLGV